MYERFYDLRERPFALSPDPAYLYRSSVHSEALSYLRYGIEGYAGFVVITGEVGSGKTTLLQTTLRSLHDRTSVSRLMNTMLDARELVEAVMLGFGMEPDVHWSKPRLLRELVTYLVEQRQAGRFALLVIDEAQNLSLAALEEVRMLSNFETERSKLLQIVLVGQPGLRDTLARPELEQLRQRITVSYHLRALNRDETAAYINHRLRRAALGTPLEFPPEVAHLIQRYSGGVPRTVNVIADAMLMFGYSESHSQMTLDLAERTIQDLIEHGILGQSRPETAVPLERTTVANNGPSPRVSALPPGVPGDRRRGQPTDGRRRAEPPAAVIRTPSMAAAETPPRPAPPPVPAATPQRASAPEPPVELPYLRSYAPIASRPGFWGRLRRGFFGAPSTGEQEVF